MPTYPRYLTYQPDELEARLRELDPTGQFPVTSLTAPASGSGSEIAGLPGRGRLVKSHSCPVSFPDGQDGSCAYTRGGPAWHQFRFTHHGTDGASTSLPVLHMTERVGNDPGSIEEAAKRLASLAYTAAIRRERTDYFQRASEGGGRRRRPGRCQMKMERARQLAGKYALCRVIGGERLVPVSTTFESLDAVNEVWREKGDRNLVVACCNRLDRCWEVPRYNPLYATFDPRPRLRTPEGAAAAALTCSLPTRATAPAVAPATAPAASSTAQEDDWAYLPGPDCPDCGDGDSGDEDLDAWDESDEEEDEEQP